MPIQVAPRRHMIPGSGVHRGVIQQNCIGSLSSKVLVCPFRLFTTVDHTVTDNRVEVVSTTNKCAATALGLEFTDRIGVVAIDKSVATARMSFEPVLSASRCWE